MAIQAGPYPVSIRDNPTYRATVGYVEGMGFWFSVVDERDEQVDGGGVDESIAHLVQLMSASWIYIDWPAEGALVTELARYDKALWSKNPQVTALLFRNAA